jgi:hypothetical protein
MAKQFALDYIDVAERIVEFRTKHPDGSLQQQALDFKEVAGGWWVVYTAAAYRSPDDPRPGIGTAWEPVPGKTNFTRDSELQNAETAAWGRAIVAALAADTKRGIASAEEVRNRQQVQPDPIIEARVAVKDAWEANNGSFDRATVEDDYSQWAQGELLSNATAERLYQYADHLKQEATA